MPVGIPVTWTDFREVKLENAVLAGRGVEFVSDSTSAQSRHEMIDASCRGLTAQRCWELSLIVSGLIMDVTHIGSSTR